MNDGISQEVLHSTYSSSFMLLTALAGVTASAAIHNTSHSSWISFVLFVTSITSEFSASPGLYRIYHQSSHITRSSLISAAPVHPWLWAICTLHLHLHCLHAGGVATIFGRLVGVVAGKLFPIEICGFCCFILATSERPLIDLYNTQYATSLIL